jgi:hypothetical protein
MNHGWVEKKIVASRFKRYYIDSMHHIDKEKEMECDKLRTVVEILSKMKLKKQKCTIKIYFDGQKTNNLEITYVI